MTIHNQTLANLVLKNKFTLVLFAVNSLGEIHDKSYKIKKSDFFRAAESYDIAASLVDDFPENIEPSHLYIKTNGKMAWLQEKEEFYG